MEQIESILEYELMGTPLSRYLLSLLAVISAMVVRKILSTVSDHWLRKLADRVPGKEDDRLLMAIHKPFTYIMLVVGIYAGIFVLQPTPNVVAIATVAFRVAMVALTLWLLLKLVDVVFFFLIRRAQRTASTIDDQIVLLIRSSVKVFLYIVAIVNIMDALGQDVGAIVAGLGIGGLAFALAAKDTVANLFGSIAILLDKPFRIGDRIVVGDTDGVVETLGFRTTRIRTLEKTLVSIPNSEMVVNTIENISRRPFRKVVMTVGVTYDTNHQQMKQVLSTLRDLLAHAADVRNDDFYVYFTEFGGSSLDIKVIYWINHVDYAPYLQVRERINLEIMKRLDALQVEIAFPSRTVYMKTEPPQ